MAVAYSGSWSQLNTYRNQAVISLTPGELLLKTYDLILSALEAEDVDRACRGLAQLIDCLDFRYQEIASGLFRLYRYCMEQTKKGEFETVAAIVADLRQTWATAIERSGITG